MTSFMRCTRSGFTLIEMAMAIGIGLSVAIAAFAAVDATAKTISGSKQQALEDDLLASAVRWLRQEPAGVALESATPGQPGALPWLFHEDVLGVTAGWPAHWPQLRIAAANPERIQSHPNGAITRSYVFSITDAAGNIRNRVVLPITRLP